jgi:NAD(P)-dependent dehydrogenase (short-subunit alcohol dehydrogenase family)
VIERAGGGVLLLLASGAGVRGGSSSLVYGASKGGVNGLAMTLTAQLAPRGIRLHVICPGSVDTPMKRDNIRKGALRAGRSPEDAVAASTLADPAGVARVLTFLASRDADFALGTVFTR